MNAFRLLTVVVIIENRKIAGRIYEEQAFHNSFSTMKSLLFVYSSCNFSVFDADHCLVEMRSLLVLFRLFYILSYIRPDTAVVEGKS